MDFRRGATNPYQQDDDREEANFSLKVVKWGKFGGLCVMYTIGSLIYFTVTGLNVVEPERFAAKQWVDANVVSPAKQNGWIAVSDTAEWMNGFIYMGDTIPKDTQDEKVAIINSK